MPTVRDRAADTLLRVGTDNSLDRLQVTRGLDTVPSGTPGHRSALEAMEVARWVDAAVLWVSWRLRRIRL